MHGCLRLTLAQRYRGTSAGRRGGMSKPQGSEWIYSPASIIFGQNGPVVPSQCGIDNTERKDEQAAEKRQAGREGGETFPSFKSDSRCI